MNAPHPNWRAVDAALNDLVGLPFSRGARGPAAFDCWGLVLEARRRLGLPLPPDFPSGELSPDAVHALFLTERPDGWHRSALTHGAVVLAVDAEHAGVHLAGRILHASRRGVVAWSLGHWSANFGALECWEADRG
jgi:cell wall-associated NlpC family hydrolase